jgi:hypothetical protein
MVLPVPKGHTTETFGRIGSTHKPQPSIAILIFFSFQFQKLFHPPGRMKTRNQNPESQDYTKTLYTKWLFSLQSLILSEIIHKKWVAQKKRPALMVKEKHNDYTQKSKY